LIIFPCGFQLSLLKFSLSFDPWEIHHIWYQSKFHLKLNPTPICPKATSNTFLNRNIKPTIFSRAWQKISTITRAIKHVHATLFRVGSFVVATHFKHEYYTHDLKREIWSFDEIE